MNNPNWSIKSWSKVIGGSNNTVSNSGSGVVGGKNNSSISVTSLTAKEVLELKEKFRGRFEIETLFNWSNFTRNWKITDLINNISKSIEIDSRLEELEQIITTIEEMIKTSRGNKINQILE